MGHPGYSFEKQVVDTESDKMTLNLVYKQLKGGTPAIMTIFIFWGLYDKLPEKKNAYCQQNHNLDILIS